MTSFLTVQDLKAYPLPVTDKQWEKITDPQIQRVLDAATLAVQNWMDRRLLTGTYTQRIMGKNRNTLVLNEYPVTSLQSISSIPMGNSNFTAIQTYSNILPFWNVPQDYGPELFLINSEAGMISWLDAFRHSFWKGYMWTISYTAGLSSIPEDVKYATALQAIEMLQPLFRGGTGMQGLELISNINERIVDTLEPYKRKRMG